MSRKDNYIDDENYVPKAFKKSNSQKEINFEEKPHRSKRRHEAKRNRKINIKGINIKQINLKQIKIKKVIMFIIIAIILVLAIRVGITTHKWKTLAKDMMIQENSIVKDIDNNTIAEIGSNKNKKYIKLNNMPNNLKNAYVAIEDERFYSHIGIDVKRTGAAIATYVFHFGSSSYGGSTITQQLVKNLTGDNTDSITRKAKEWWKAFQLETCTTKDEILETYLNVIYVGPNVYGVEAGSKYYFNKSASDLKLAECAFLAGINNSPNSYNPFKSTDNTEKINKRTKTVLAKMKELKYISESEYNEAIEDVENGLKFKKGNFDDNSKVYSYHTDSVVTEILADLEKKYDISETFANNYIEMAGLTIYSTQDSSIQKQMETEFAKGKYSLASKNGGDSSQAAMVIIDHSTGNVLGCVGGLGTKKESRVFNRATQSIRQTGSAIKPIAVLAPAIDKKIITAATICDDTVRDFGNDGYRPTDLTKALGKITVRRAVESSQNIPFVEIMQKLKPSNSIKYMEKMGITTLTKNDNSLPLALGGLDKGISPLEMAGAYATIANDGVYIEPTFYSKIDKKSGVNVIKTSQKSRRVFSKEVAYILKSILTQPVEGTYGTATYCKIPGVDVAAKTGTTDENYDRWLCGFTPYYTAATWYGYDINESINYNKKNPAGLIWANVMSRIHSGKSSAQFVKPSGITSCEICSKTGKKARSGCTDTYTEYFLWLTAPGLCNEHSGSETKNSNNNVKNTVQDVVQNITEEIDAVDPQQLLPKDDDKKEETTNNITTKNTTTNDTKTNTTTTNQTVNNKTNEKNTNTIQKQTNTVTQNTTTQNTTTENKTVVNTIQNETIKNEITTNNKDNSNNKNE